MSDVRSDLRAYYEEEARRSLRRSPRGRRVDLRADCVSMLRSEQRASVIDFGAGPGGDAAAFLEAGIGYTGLDLAHGNAVTAATAGITVVHGSIADPPLRPAQFAAGWSMSTLMHVPEGEVPVVLEAMVQVLMDGAPLFIGQWGGQLGDHIDDTELAGQRRLFSLRSFECNRDLISDVATIERDEVWPVGPDGWEYHVFVARTLA